MYVWIGIMQCGICGWAVGDGVRWEGWRGWTDSIPSGMKEWCFKMIWMDSDRDRRRRWSRTTGKKCMLINYHERRLDHITCMISLDHISSFISSSDLYYFKSEQDYFVRTCLFFPPGLSLWHKLRNPSIEFNSGIGSNGKWNFASKFHQVTSWDQNQVGDNGRTSVTVA